MRMYDRICIKDYSVTAQNGDHFEIKRGQEYITSFSKFGKVIVYSNFWVKVPTKHFAGAVLFTKC